MGWKGTVKTLEMKEEMIKKKNLSHKTWTAKLTVKPET